MIVYPRISGPFKNDFKNRPQAPSPAHDPADDPVIGPVIGPVVAPAIQRFMSSENIAFLHARIQKVMDDFFGQKTCIKNAPIYLSELKTQMQHLAEAYSHSNNTNLTLHRMNYECIFYMCTVLAESVQSTQNWKPIYNQWLSFKDLPYPKVDHNSHSTVMPHDYTVTQNPWGRQHRAFILTRKLM